MFKLKILLPVVLCLLLAGSLFTQEDVTYQIVVNKSNPVSMIDLNKVAKYFMKKESEWEHGEKVYPVDLQEESMIRQRFSREVHRKSAEKVNSYWQVQIFKGKNIPPPQLIYEDDVLSFVNENPGAIGYVSKSAPISSYNVKVIAVK